VYQSLPVPLQCGTKALREITPVSVPYGRDAKGVSRPNATNHAMTKLYGVIYAPERARWLRRQLRKMPKAIGAPSGILANILTSLEPALTVMEGRTGKPLRHQHDRLYTQLERGTYRYGPMKQVWIESPKGRTKSLSVPSGTDRAVSKAILDGIKRSRTAWDKDSSTEVNQGMSISSWCLPRKGTMRQLSRLIEAPTGWIFALDIKGFFPSLPEDLTKMALLQMTRQRKWRGMITSLIGRTETKAQCPPWAAEMLTKSNKPIPAYKGGERARITGVPLGDPLSPLASNLIGTLMDRWIKARGYEHQRYMDDVNVIVRSQRSGLSIWRNIREYLKTLNLTLSEGKTRLIKGDETDYQKVRILGFHLYSPKSDRQRWRLVIPEDTQERLIQRIRESRSRPEMEGLLMYWTQGESLTRPELNQALTLYREGHSYLEIQEALREADHTRSEEIGAEAGTESHPIKRWLGSVIRRLPSRRRIQEVTAGQRKGQSRTYSTATVVGIGFMYLIAGRMLDWVIITTIYAGIALYWYNDPPHKG